MALNTMAQVEQHKSQHIT